MPPDTDKLEALKALPKGAVVRWGFDIFTLGVAYKEFSEEKNYCWVLVGDTSPLTSNLLAHEVYDVHAEWVEYVEEWKAVK